MGNLKYLTTKRLPSLGSNREKHKKNKTLVEFAEMHTIVQPNDEVGPRIKIQRGNASFVNIQSN